MFMKVSDSATRFIVPVGFYRARLLGFKEMEANQKFKDSKPSYVWEFEIIEGEQAGKTVGRFTPQVVAAANGLGKLMVELLGRPLVTDENIDVEKLINVAYEITVGYGQDGVKTKVTKVVPLGSNPLKAPKTSNGPPLTQPPKPATIIKPAVPTPTPLALSTIPEKIWVSFDGVCDAEEISYHEGYTRAGTEDWKNAMIYDEKAKRYVKAVEYFLPF